MAKPISFGKIGVGLTAGAAGQAVPLDPEGPFRILLLGDFSGRASRGPAETSSGIGSRRPAPVDRDNLEQVLGQFGPALCLASNSGPPIFLEFSELDDFHPDRLLERVPVLKELRQTRARLENPATFADAAAEVRLWSDPTTDPAPQQPPRPSPMAVSDQGLLEQILGGAPEGKPRSEPPSTRSDWNQFLGRIVEPHLVARADHRQADLLAAVDETIAAQLRLLLHHPDFQTLEAAWRGVHRLVRRLDTDTGLSLHLLDVTPAELTSDLTSSDDLSASHLYRLLVEPARAAPGATPWSLLAGLYTFDRTAADVEVLGRLAHLARAARAPFLAAASPAVLGCASAADLREPRRWRRDTSSAEDPWQALRQLPEASWLGLALPRVLLRLPYGRESSPTERLEFEEMPGPPAHEDYLWGNPAFVAVELLGAAFNRAGWGLRPGMVEELDGLPLHVVERDGERYAQPCAEVLLPYDAADAVLEHGLMPVLSVRDRDAVQLPRFRSLAEGDAALAGPWH